jgi:hypothetical protein
VYKRQVLARSIRKYCKENFNREILEFFPDRESLREREGQIVNEDFVDDKMCMNVKLGGEKGNFGTTIPNRKSSPLSESHKANISKSCEGKAGKYEKTDDHKQKLRDVNLGKKQDDETKEKRAESLRNFWKENPNAEESKLKKSESLKEAWKLRKGNPQKKRVYTKPLSMTPGAIKIRIQRMTHSINNVIESFSNYEFETLTDDFMQNKIGELNLNTKLTTKLINGFISGQVYYENKVLDFTIINNTKQ